MYFDNTSESAGLQKDWQDITFFSKRGSQTDKHVKHVSKLNKKKKKKGEKK